MLENTWICNYLYFNNKIESDCLGLNVRAGYTM